MELISHSGNPQLQIDVLVTAKLGDNRVSLVTASREDPGLHVNMVLPVSAAQYAALEAGQKVIVSVSILDHW